MEVCVLITENSVIRSFVEVCVLITENSVIRSFVDVCVLITENSIIRSFVEVCVLITEEKLAQLNTLSSIILEAFDGVIGVIFIWSASVPASLSLRSNAFTLQDLRSS